MYLIYTLFIDILFIKSSMKTWLIFLKAPLVVIRCVRRPCVTYGPVFFPFHNVQNYHGNLGFLSWNIIEKSLKFFEACLWEPWKCALWDICLMHGGICEKGWYSDIPWRKVSPVTLALERKPSNLHLTNRSQRPVWIVWNFIYSVFCFVFCCCCF